MRWLSKALLLPGLVLLACGLLHAQEPDTLWLRTYGGYGDDIAGSVRMTSDGGYILGGYSNSFGGAWEFYLVKTDSVGLELWSKTYGGPNWDFGEVAIQTSDGGFAFAGYGGPMSLYDVMLIKIDAVGNEVWRNTYGGSQLDEGLVVEELPDKGFMIAGITASEGAGGYDYYLIKTDSLGVLDWSRTYGGPGSDVCFSAQRTTDSGYILAGYTNSYGPGLPNWSNTYLVKTDSLGDTLWTAVHGIANQDEVPYSVSQTLDGGYILGGYLHPFASQSVWAMKVDSLGGYEWDNEFDGSRGASIRQTPDGNYIFAGYWAFDSTSYDFYILRLDSAGDVIWSKLYGGPSNEIDMALSVEALSDSEFVFAGRTESWGASGTDYFLMKIAPTYVGVQESGSATNDWQVSPCAPNPFSERTSLLYKIAETTQVEVVVYNTLGQRIRTLVHGVHHAGRYELTWDGSNESGRPAPNGLYFLKFTAGAREGSESLLLIR